jgi:hypothetical protein
MKTRITSYILTQLFRTTSEDDIIYSVCEKTGLDWDDAQALVEQVKQEHKDEIEARQMPVKSILAALFYLLGIALIVWPVIYLWGMLDITKTFLGFIEDPSARNAETAMYLFARRCALLGWFQLPSLFFTVAVGIGIIQANMRYMRGLWENLFRQWNVID